MGSPRSGGQSFQLSLLEESTLVTVLTFAGTWMVSVPIKLCLYLQVFLLLFSLLLLLLLLLWLQ